MLWKQDELIETHLYLQAKYREVQEQYTKLRHYYVLTVQEQYVNLRHLYLLIECAWCKRRIGWKRKEPSVPGETSHGICLPCAAHILTQMYAGDTTSAA
jgi:hypothetical protein